MVSVTQILGHYDNNKKFYDERSAQFGTNIHLATQYDDTGVLDEDNLDPALLPWLSAWRKFKDQFKPNFKFIEERFNCKDYTGKPDRIALIYSKLTLIDIKTGGAGIFSKLQVAAYSNLVKEAKGINIDKAYIVKLDPERNGEPYNLTVLKKKELKKYLNDFKSLKNTYLFLKENNLIKE